MKRHRPSLGGDPRPPSSLALQSPLAEAAGAYVSLSALNPVGAFQGFPAVGKLTAGAAGIGKVMAVDKPQLAGRADMAAVSAKVKARLAG